MMNPKIKHTIGELPQFWDKNIIFFANLLGLFYGNEGETNSLKSLVGGLSSYGGRLVPIINLLFQGSNNTLILETEPDHDLMKYFSDTLLLSLPQIAILPFSEYSAILKDNNSSEPHQYQHVINSLFSHIAENIDGFVTDQMLLNIAEKIQKTTINTVDSSKASNNKLRLHQFLSACELPVFDTYLAPAPPDIKLCISKLSELGYCKAVIKSQIGASGIGMEIVDISNINSSVIPEYIFYEGPVLVQGWLDKDFENVDYIGSPSIQLFIDEESVFLYDITEQILGSDSIHEGNMAPPEYRNRNPQVIDEMIRQAEKGGQWLYNNGYRGTASIDFHVIQRNGQEEIRICEINARVTGATYPAVLARHFAPKRAWLMRNLKFSSSLTGAELLSRLDQNSKLFKPENNSGILPINLNVDQSHVVHKGQFLFIGDNISECTSLLAQIDQCLPVAWSYDRD